MSHNTYLKQLITERIREKGPITFKDFMEMSLYYPNYGYYTSDSSVFGCKGDFYTSSHVHPVFGAVIGKQIEQMWCLLERPEKFYIIEIGAGKGYMANDMLSYVKHEQIEFFQAVQYIIVEINPLRRKSQQYLLRNFREKVEWKESLSTISGIKGCIISNELIDSFPVHLIQTKGERLQEVYVDAAKDSFTEVLYDCGPEIPHYLQLFKIKLPDGYRTEINLLMKDWLRDVSSALNEGFLFTIDYGYPSWDYYSPGRSRGTLLCYYRHLINENPFQNIGKQDISAHVNFSAMKKWGNGYGLKTIGFCPQGQFLVSLGIDDVLKQMNNDVPHSLMHSRVSALISPEGMGESHKVIIQYKGEGEPQLMGFSLRNHADRL